MNSEAVSKQSRIAAWKIWSDEEKRLAHLADHSHEAKKAYVQYYMDHDPEYYQKGLLMIDKVISLFLGDDVSPEERELYHIDMVYSLHRFGCMFDEYFLYHYPILNTKGRESFITDKLRWSYYDRLNAYTGDRIFDNKLTTYQHFGPFYKREVIHISDEQDRTLFSGFSKRHNPFVVKPIDGSGGRGIEIQYCNDADETFDLLLRERKECIIEEIIPQSRELSRLHPTSVNTLRLPTVRAKGEVHLFHPLLRVGVGDGCVDNATAGGIFALVDPETGILFTEARDEKGHKYITHPDTGIPFPGFQLPEWEQAVSLVKDLSKVVPDNRYVGWDLAHTDDGWIMVEGNPCGQIIMMQLFYETGFRDELENLIQLGESER